MDMKKIRFGQFFQLMALLGFISGPIHLYYGSYKELEVISGIPFSLMWLGAVLGSYGMGVLIVRLGREDKYLNDYKRSD